MTILAYSPDPSYQRDLERCLPGGERLHWVTMLDDLNGAREWQRARAMVLIASCWPDEQLERLLKGFLPKPVVLIDTTAEGQWQFYGNHRQLHLANFDNLQQTLEWLLLPEPVAAGGALALLTPRNDYDGAILTIATAWVLSARHRKRVLVLDFALPQCDIAAYLGAAADYSLSDLVNHRHVLDEAWLQQRLATASGIHVLALSPDDELGALSGSEVREVLARLEQHYDHLLFNLTGQGMSSLVSLVAECCSHLWLLADQKNISIKSAAVMAEYLLGQGVRPACLGLVLAPYYPQQVPDAGAIGQRLEIPVLACLPDMHELITLINAGQLLPPKPPLAPLLKAIAGLVGQPQESPWWARWIGRKHG